MMPSVGQCWERCAMRQVLGTRLIGLLPLVLLAIHGTAAAQTTLDPTKATFTASRDHSATFADGTPVVQFYQLDFYIVGASAPFQSVNLGKPPKDATNTITVDLTTVFVGWPLPGTVYVSDVEAIGPGGTSASARSNTFGFSNPGSSPNPGGSATSPDGTMVPPAAQIVDNAGAIWTIGASYQILRNDVRRGAGRGGESLWQNAMIYARGTENVWWQWSGSNWVNIGTIQPGSTTQPGSPTQPGSTTISPDGTAVPPATRIVDNSGAIWTIGASYQILRN